MRVKTRDMRVIASLWAMAVVLVMIQGSAGWCLEEGPDYTQLLRETLDNLIPRFEGIPSGTSVVSGGAPEHPFYLPVPAFRDPNTVPYLIDVLENGEQWPDLSGNLQAYYSQLAQCYAARVLGYMGGQGDARVFDPLVNALNSPPDINAPKIGMSRAYNLRCAAAHGLANTGDTSAIGPLVAALERTEPPIPDDKWGERKSDYAACLASFRDLRAFEPLLKYAVNNYGTSHALLYLMRINYEGFVDSEAISSFPELRELLLQHNEPAFWRHWLNGGGQRYAKRVFDQSYQQLQAIGPEDLRWDNLIWDMTHGGILVLPYVIEKIEAGDKGLERALELLTAPSLAQSADGGKVSKPNPNIESFNSREKTLAWWRRDRDKWLIDLDGIRSRILGD